MSAMGHPRHAPLTIGALLLLCSCHLVHGLQFEQHPTPDGPVLADATSDAATLEAGGEGGAPDAPRADRRGDDASGRDTGPQEASAGDAAVAADATTDAHEVDAPASDRALRDNPAQDGEVTDALLSSDAPVNDSALVDTAPADTGTTDACVADCSGRCGGAEDGCGGTCSGCLAGSWCDGQVCRSCNSAAHCGVGCQDCTAGPTDRQCVYSGNAFVCGCANAVTDCAPTQSCSVGFCTGNFDQCAAGVDSCDPCSSDCVDERDENGQWRWSCACRDGFYSVANNRCALAHSWSSGGQSDSISLSGAGVTYDITTMPLDPRRSCADAASYSVVQLGDTTARVEPTPGACCFYAEDQALLINLQGTPTDNTNVGHWELVDIYSVTGNRVSFRQSKALRYGSGPGDDLEIGTLPGQQRVMLMRVPDYTTLNIGDQVTVTAQPWDGLKGGVLAVQTRALRVSGRVDMQGRGFRGGLSICGDGNPVRAQPGESMAGLGLFAAGDAVFWQSAAMGNVMGGGGGCCSGSGTILGGGGGGHGWAGETAVCAGSCDLACQWDAAGGMVLGFPDLRERAYLGSGGGGGGGQGASCTATHGAPGGGLVFLFAQAELTVGQSGRVTADGDSAGSGSAPGGSGAGGGVYLWSLGDVTTGSEQVTARGGGAAPDGSAGGDGRIMLHLDPSSQLTGETAPSAHVLRQ